MCVCVCVWGTRRPLRNEDENVVHKRVLLKCNETQRWRQLLNKKKRLHILEETAYKKMINHDQRYHKLYVTISEPNITPYVNNSFTFHKSAYYI